ncbi:MAG: 6-phosphogluconolactonase, partial [Candidatus Parcubacteria bacterium]
TFPWEQTYLYYSDERFVPHESSDSNTAVIRASGILEKIPPQQHHPFPICSTAQECAIEYATCLREHLPQLQFDAVLLGVGEDGHVASLFPQFMTDEVQNVNLTTYTLHSPKAPPTRISLTFNAISHAQRIFCIILGSGKQEIFQKIAVEGYVCPATHVCADATHAQLYADTEAAASNH